MNTAKMRIILEDMLASLDDDTPDEPYRACTAEDLLQELRESRRMLADAFRKGVADGERELRASVQEHPAPPQRKTRLAYANPGSEADVVDRIAQQVATPDPERDVLAASATELHAGIAQAMRELHPGARLAEMSAEVHTVPTRRKLVGQCTGEVQQPWQNSSLIWSRD